MERLCTTMGSMEEAIQALERRGINLRTHANRMNFETNRLPVFHVVIDNTDYWFTTRKELDDFIKEQEKKTGGELTVETGESSKEKNEDSDLGIETGSISPSLNGAADTLHITEFHEVRTINSGLQELIKLGFTVDALLAQERTGLEEARYTLTRGDSEIGINDLRSFVNAVRAAGEKGMSVTRFKGLGEMNAEELRETTLDPENRTLIQIKMTNAAEADEMFRVLMGDKVEPRREFIEKHSLEVKTWMSNSIQSGYRALESMKNSGEPKA